MCMSAANPVIYRVYVRLTFPVFLKKKHCVYTINILLKWTHTMAHCSHSPSYRTGQGIHVCCSEKGVVLVLYFSVSSVSEKCWLSSFFWRREANILQ